MSMTNHQNISLGVPLKSNGQCRVFGDSSRVTVVPRESEHRSDYLLTENSDLLRDHWKMPSPDIQTLNWIQAKNDYKWYLFTVTFKDSSVGSKREKYINLFDTFVRKRIQKKIGYSYRVIMEVREYECSVIGASGNIHCPHHVHCILGIPVTARNDRLIKHYQSAIAHPNSRVIESANLQELRTGVDVERAYYYIRKGKWHRMLGA